MKIKIPEEAKNFFRDGDLKKVNNIEWDAEDWEIFYHCIGFALWKISRRTNRKNSGPAIDFQI